MKQTGNASLIQRSDDSYLNWTYHLSLGRRHRWLRALVTVSILLAMALPVAAKPLHILNLAYPSLAKTEAERSKENSRWQSLADSLGKYGTIKLHAIGFEKTDALIQGFKSRQIQVAVLGNIAALDAVSQTQGGVVVFAQALVAPESGGNHSVIISHKQSPIQSLADAIAEPGKYSLQTAEAKSIAATLIPLYYAFEKQDIAPEVIFKKVSQGNQESNLIAVAKKEVDLATLSSQMLEGKFKEELPREYAAVKVVWTSEPIKGDAVVYRHDLAFKDKKALDKCFIKFGKNPDEQALLNAVRSASGFIPSSNVQLAQIADIQQFQELQDLAANSAIGEDQKRLLKAGIETKYRKLNERYIGKR